MGLEINESLFCCNFMTYSVLWGYIGLNKNWYFYLEMSSANEHFRVDVLREKIKLLVSENRWS